MFITFEGIDFCGKSTQIDLLKNYLKNEGNTVHVIREPGGTDIGEKVRDVLLDKKNNQMVIETELFLFSASRAQLIREIIKPYLKKGHYVISDRLHDSTTAYQGFGRGINLDYIKTINKLAIGETVPDITFLIDISIDEMIKRKNEKFQREPDRMELNNRGFFNKVREGYIWIASDDPKRVKCINGMKPINDVYQEIIGEIKKYLE